MKNTKNTKENQQELSCCGEKPKKEPKNLGQAILYGLIPHIGCIAFIIGSILGVTVLTQFFRPLLMNRNFFYILILISLLFATLASALYLRRLGFLSIDGIKKKWKYLATMYGTTIGVNLLLFMVIFPLLANVSVASSLPAASSPLGGAAGSASTNENLAALKLKVDIPCSGHAPLISSELKTIAGVQDVKFSFPNNFDVTYDATKTNKQAILSLGVFQEYKATVVSEINQLATQQNSFQGSTQLNAQPSATGATGGCGCGGGSGGCGGCSGSAGGCGGSAGGCGGSGSSGSGTCGVKY